MEFLGRTEVSDRLRGGSRMTIRCTLAVLVSVTACLPEAAADLVELNLRTRDPQTGKVVVTPTKIDPAKTAVVAVDVWNYHWCKTATQRVAALVPRMDRCLEEARKMGMQVFLCPTDAVDQYVGMPQREAVFAVPIRPLPELSSVECPRPPSGGGCACGREKCLVNYGWDGMHPSLTIRPSDLMPNSFETLYWLCKDRNIRTLVFVGFHTQVCLLGKSVGLRNMKRAGFDCILARDLTDAHPDYDPARGLTPDGLTAATVAHFEKYLCPSIDFYSELKRIGHCLNERPLDPVRVTPWGTPMRPHLFEQPVTVTLSAPFQPNATICYTTDGSEPTPQSRQYVAPFEVLHTTKIRARAFENGNAVCVESVGSFVKLAAMPPMPDAHLDELAPLHSVGPGHSPSDESHRFSSYVSPPQKNRNNRGRPLRLCRKTYDRGIGVHAPNQTIYALKPEHDRFVALAGVDDDCLGRSNGTNTAMYPSVVFHVFIDGRQAARSPVMRIGFQPWRFNVEIPDGARIVSLSVSDAGNGNRHDLANWVNAGFVTSEESP